MTHRRRRRWNKTYSKYNKIAAPKIDLIEDSTQTPVVKVSSSSQTDIELSQVKKKPFNIQQLESVNRIVNLPIVESGWHYAENVYNKIKKSHNLIFWTLGQAEQSFLSVVDTAQPAILLFQGPISTIDKIVCKSLDLVEDKVPSINLPPEMIYWNTKQYVSNVSNQIVRPVLKRANSVKEIGNTVLASKYTAYAADTLDGALDVADKYVDKYLPADDDQTTDTYASDKMDGSRNAPDKKVHKYLPIEDQTSDAVDKPVDGPTGKAINTIHHVDRFSRKLKRRLTKRTLAEVKALKEHSAEAVHVLIYVAELIATDPKLALQKGKELWLSLSKDEPENQARPENVEQLIVMLTRESARRMVHLINFTSGIVSKVPKQLSNTVVSMASKALHLTDSMVKTVHMEAAQKVVIDVLKVQVHHSALVLKHLNNYIEKLLDEVAEKTEEKEKPKTALSVPQIKVQLRAAQYRNSINTTTATTTIKSTTNGVDNNF